MKKQLSRAAALLLLVSFGISALLYLFLDVAQLQFKMEARQDVDGRAHLQTLKVSLKEFKGQEKNDDVWINGKLYDISSYVVIDDTAFVSVFHDEHEEGLVKAIVNSFEPSDKYTNDNIVHLSKHHVHAPGDGKVLVARHTFQFNEPSCSRQLLPHFIHHSSGVAASVIKPPPRIS